MYKGILVLHIIFGAICLLAGIAAIISKKGGKFHTSAGKAFYVSMYGVGISAFVMTLMKFNPFLLSIAIFSVFASYSGRKAIFYWRLKQAYTPTIKDKLPSYIALFTALFMIGYPIAVMINRKEFFVPILGVFGTLLLIGAAKDLRRFRMPEKFTPGNKEWLLLHIGNMSGAYIATVTAFLLNNFHVEQPWVLWLGPTIIGLPLISLTVRKWKIKLKL